MQDTYNLAWKICSVINGTAKPEILETYETERRQVALDLVAADMKINSYYNTRRCGDGLDRTLDYKSLRNSLYEFLSGAAVNYGPSILTLKQNLPPADSHVSNEAQTLPDTNPLASNLKIGTRIPSYKLTNQADARWVHLAELLPSDTRWRLLTFAGNLSDPIQSRRVHLLGHFLASAVRKFAPAHRPIDSVIEILTVHSGPRREFDLLGGLHDVFHPWDEVSGWDYWKVFVDEPDALLQEGFDDVYGRFGIDRVRGCVVICRPDQHVGCVVDVDDFVSIGRYFEGVLNAVGGMDGDVVG